MAGTMPRARLRVNRGAWGAMKETRRRDERGWTASTVSFAVRFCFAKRLYRRKSQSIGHSAEEDDMRDYDVFVVGGGVNGCGVARDAAGRGYSVGPGKKLGCSSWR